MNELLDVSTEPVKTAQTNSPGTEPSRWMPLSDEARNTMPENIKGLFETKKWSSVEDVATGYSELEKVLGKGAHIFKPESPDDVDGWNKYYQQLGVPEEHEYEYEADETVPFDDALIDRFRKFSKDIHLNKEQSAGIVKFQRDIVKEVMAAELEAAEIAEATKTAEIEEVRKALVQRFGGEVAYKDKVMDARRIADELGIYQTLERLGLASNPEVIGMLTDISEKVTEGVIGKGTQSETSAKDPKTELKEIIESETFKNKFAPGRKEVMKRYMELCTIISNSGNAPIRMQGS